MRASRSCGQAGCRARSRPTRASATTGGRWTTAGDVMADGMRGQFVYVDRPRRVVVVKTSAWPYEDPWWDRQCRDLSTSPCRRSPSPMPPSRRRPRDAAAVQLVPRWPHDASRHRRAVRSAPSRVQSVDRALSLLDRVAAAAPEGETAARLCGRSATSTGRPPGGCSGTRGTTAWSSATRSPTATRSGFALLRMSAAAGYDGLVRETRPILERVSAQTGETADLAVAGLHGVTYVGEVAPPSVLPINWLAREVPLHATSTGKAFLAWLPPDEARGLLEKPLHAFTETTVTDPTTLMDELAATRARGYAECAGELEPTLFGVSAPVLSAADGRPMAVFSIWGPVSRVPLAVRRARADRGRGGRRRARAAGRRRGRLGLLTPRQAARLGSRRGASRWADRGLTERPEITSALRAILLTTRPSGRTVSHDATYRSHRAISMTLDHAATTS